MLDLDVAVHPRKHICRVGGHRHDAASRFGSGFGLAVPPPRSTARMSFFGVVGIRRSFSGTVIPSPLARALYNTKVRVAPTARTAVRQRSVGTSVYNPRILGIPCPSFRGFVSGDPAPRSTRIEPRDAHPPSPLNLSTSYCEPTLNLWLSAPPSPPRRRTRLRTSGHSALAAAVSARATSRTNRQFCLSETSFASARRRVIRSRLGSFAMTAAMIRLCGRGGGGLQPEPALA